MVPKAEFERVRRLLGEALQKEFEGHPFPPIEMAPGYWKLWPHRSVRVKLEESRFWMYGRPMGGTGNLQVKMYYPYNSERFSSKGAFTDRAIKRIAKNAKENSEGLAKLHHDDTPEAKQAYFVGYKAVEDATEEERQNLWIFRGPTWREQRPNWDDLHTAIRAFLKMPDVQGVLDWIPDEASDPKWDSLLKTFDDSTLYDKAMRGTLDAIDDWAIQRGLITEEEYVRE